MKRPVRHEDGTYHIDGHKYKMLIGSRTQVHNKTAYKTEGGLTNDKLMMNKWGRIVSLVKHRTAKKEKRLEKAGYFAKKGKFGYVKKTVRKSGKAMRSSRKMKGRKMRGGVKTREEIMDLNRQGKEEEKDAYEKRIDDLVQAELAKEQEVETPESGAAPGAEKTPVPGETPVPAPTPAAGETPAGAPGQQNQSDKEDE